MIEIIRDFMPLMGSQDSDGIHWNLMSNKEQAIGYYTHFYKLPNGFILYGKHEKLASLS